MTFGEVIRQIDPYVAKGKSSYQNAKRRMQNSLKAFSELKIFFFKLGYNAGQQSQISSNEGQYDEGFGDGSRSQSRINFNRDQIKYDQGFLDGQKENVDPTI